MTTAKKNTNKTEITVGYEFTTAQGCNASVIEDNGSRNLVIKFTETGNTKTVPRSSVKTGRIKNPMKPYVEGIGYIGVGKYKEGTTAYKKWAAMLSRCYGKEMKNAYIDVTVCKEWRNYQNFAKWFHEESNYQDGWQLDKDILSRGQRIYSPNTCLFVPKGVNISYGKDPTKATLPKRNRIKSLTGKTRVIYKGQTLGTNDDELANINLRLCKLEDTFNLLFKIGDKHPLTLQALESLENQIRQLDADYIEADSKIFLEKTNETNSNQK
ncbi:hypothetical protein [Thiomicrorhabdus sp.]|uniref:hypothetical protein n=1 Tax=Thiomicrorhabdus sp. TaxID=2039724 RepID=UPI002AA7D151|nr:hypothetical protein [Thiomicrorhabdus sp.]